MANYKTVPNQKTVKVSKVGVKGKIFAQIEMGALEDAAKNLQAGAFKLWVYFAKNQNEYEFALSSKDVEEVFGMKIKQYNNAIQELIEKGYLVNTSGNDFIFNEYVMTKGNNVSNSNDNVISKGNNDVKPKGNNVVMPKGNNVLSPLDIRNITDITTDNTINNTVESFPAPGVYKTEKQLKAEFSKIF